MYVITVSLITATDAYITSIMYVHKHEKDGSHILVMIFSPVNLQEKPGIFELKYKQTTQPKSRQAAANKSSWNEFNSHDD